jgi:hypothetical protein
MTRQAFDTTRMTPFALWIRANCRDSRNGLSVTNIDFEVEDFRDRRHRRTMIIEEKMHMGLLAHGQARHFKRLDRASRLLAAEQNYDHWGFYLVQFSGTGPLDSALILVNGVPIYGLERYRFLGQGKVLDVIPVPTVIVAALYALAFVVLEYTRFGRFTYATGSNAETARLSGVAVGRVQVGIYAICGLLSGVASTIEAGRLAIVQPAGGNGYELLAIGAVIIGGASTFGGEGSIVATLIGAIIVTTIRNGLNILGLNAFWQYVVNGAVIIGAVAADQLRRRR